MTTRRPTDGREGYSDRMAHLMACLSNLAYIQFEDPPLNNQIKQMVEELLEQAGAKNESYKKTFGKLIALFKKNKIWNYNAEENKAKLRRELELLGMQDKDFINSDGTQAMLVEAEDNSFLVLAFRGTEATSYKDIRADLKVRQHEADGGRIHKGFHDAYEVVHNEIQSILKEHESKPLYITGHSLGGALATIAARRLEHKGGIVACYTFGSPRVGDDDWVGSVKPPIKVPIYRVVNALDIVTMLPPGDKMMRGLCFILKFIPYAKKIVPWLKQNLMGYMHAGDMRYLTNCPSGQYKSVRLLYAVDIFFRLGGFFRSLGKMAASYLFLGKKFLADHSIKIYEEKLRIIRDNRN